MPKGVPNETCGDYGGHKNNGEPCGRASGWGTDFDSGKCRKCRGTKPDGSLGENHGAPENNTNGQTHALYTQRDGYYQDLSENEQQWVFDFTNDLLDRQRRMNGREPDMFDKEALKNIAIDFHKVAHANGWFRERGIAPDDYKITPQGSLVQSGKKLNEWASEIRQYNESIYRRMKKHGLLDDPDSDKAAGLQNLAAVWEESQQN